ncbi:MAG TPA: undecaprenyldiphospho-muramoylpentapeptide beta-N-acetylglucosaminyltransferase [Clostridia bacterium]|nr:undecaprenyldiphospho-muramoylpentapeptide beta-N-acetylglucosaminyltransferase [Clostridia bacterium]
MKVLVAGGGTGGHIYPALAIARGVQDKFNAEVLYIGTSKGLESDIVPQSGFDFKTISATGLERKLSFKNVKAVWQAGKGYFEARAIIRSYLPDLVVGTGGYVCGPVVLAASRRGIPTLIHEQNAFPGITNKLLSRFTDTVAVTFEESVKYFGDKKKVRVTGLPVRQEILNANRVRASQKKELKQEKLLLLSFGGSRGAYSLNKAVLDVIARFKDEPRIQMIHVTGTLGYEDFSASIKPVKDELENVTVVPYLHNMPEVMARADLVICRAGAATIAELTVLGVPSILIPYPYAAENHQEYNARALVEKGAAELILDRDLNGDTLLERVELLLGNENRLREMALNSGAQGRPEALQDIIKLIEKIV